MNKRAILERFYNRLIDKEEEFFYRMMHPEFGQQEEDYLFPPRWAVTPFELDIILKKFDLIDVIDFMKSKEESETALYKIFSLIEDLIHFKDHTCHCRYKGIEGDDGFDYLLIIKENKPNVYKWIDDEDSISKIKITKELQLRFILSDRELTKLDWVIG